MRILPAAACFILLLLTLACGGDDDDTGTATTAPTATTAATATSAAASAAPTATPVDTGTPPAGATELRAGTGQGADASGNAIDPGTYYTGAFQPRAVLTLGEGWSAAGERPQHLLLLRKPEPGDIAFYLDTEGDEDVDLTVSRYTGITGTTAGDVTDTTVAGLPAQQFDITVIESSLAIPRLDETYTSRLDDVLHFWVFEVNGQTVKIIAEAPGAEFDAYAPIAQEVIDSLRFE